MVAPVLNIQTRESIGKNNMTKARREGSIPGVVYSRGKDTQSVYMSEKELNKVLSQYGNSTKVTLNFGGEKSFAIIKEIQRETLQNRLLHIDLQTLDENEKVRLMMPIYITNREAVESSTEIVQMQINEVEIQTYPKYLPERVEVDARLLKQKDSICIKDLNIAQDANIEMLEDGRRVIASLVYATK